MPKPIVSDTRPATGALEKASSGVRHVRLRTSGASVERRPDGSLLVRPDEPLGAYPKVLTDRVAQWAEIAPERICAAKRDKDGRWRTLTYSQVYAAVRSIAQALLDRGLSAERPVAILSENDLEHLLLMLAGAARGDSYRAYFTGVFARVEGSRAAAALSRAAYAWDGVRIGWREIPARD